jgi:Cft2 family RNA processing exonuclease
VLLPVDTAGRVLELLQILESVSREKIMAFLVLIDSTAIVPCHQILQLLILVLPNDCSVGQRKI